MYKEQKEEALSRSFMLIWPEKSVEITTSFNDKTAFQKNKLQFAYWSNCWLWQTEIEHNSQTIAPWHGYLTFVERGERERADTMTSAIYIGMK